MHDEDWPSIMYFSALSQLATFFFMKCQRLNIPFEESYGLPTMADFDPDLNDVEMSNVIGLLMIMREIRNRKPLDDPNILMVDEDGKPYY